MIVNHTEEDNIEYCKCRESIFFRINTAIATSKEKLSHPDVEVGIDTTNQTTMSNKSGYVFYIAEKDC